MANRFVRRPLLAALGLLMAACDSLPQFIPPGQAGIPAGVLEGTVTYTGLLPCTEKGFIVGAALLEVFNEDLLPPPEGLGTTATSLAVVTGEQLFDGVRSKLTFNADQSRWCPDPTSTTTVTVSAPWQAAPLSGGIYQVRGFYDRDGDFDPGLMIHRLPTKGDVAGGAVDNAIQVLQGAAPAYRQLMLGTPQTDGSYAIDDNGSIINGVTVTLGLPLPLDLPVFYAQEVLSSTKMCDNGTVKPAPAGSKDPSKVTLPADYTLPDLALASTEDSFLRIGLGAGVPAVEANAAALPPFSLPVKSPTFHFTWQDVNGDGQLTMADDHVPDSVLVPALAPLVLFTKLDTAIDPVQGRLASLSSPVVILQGLTIYKNLLATAGVGTAGDPAFQDNLSEVVVGVRPAVLCIDPLDKSKHAKLVVTHDKDCAGTHPVISDEEATRQSLKAQFKREVDIVYGCLPQGEYAVNVLYGTGQAWTVPNDAGICRPNEPSPADDNAVCRAMGSSAQRPLLPSQNVVLTIGKPDHPEYCTGAHATPPECCPNGICSE